MTSAQRSALRLSIVCLCLATSLFLFGGRGTGSVPMAQAATASTATFYGADTTMTIKALTGIWPQARGPYCGIASTVAVVDYSDLVHGVARRFTTTAGQTAIAADNQKSGASRWGYPTPLSACGGKTNISRDAGTDPRSIAYMAWNYTPNNTFYHDYIYRWQFSNKTQPSFGTQVAQATTSMARALESWHEPVIAQINGGLHSVLVTGVYAYTDPARTYPAQIASVVYRDPMGSASVSRYQVSMGTWAGGHFNTPYGVYALWSLYYGDRSVVGDGKNTSDPEPAVGIYKPTSSHPVHWYHGFTWIQRDNKYANGMWSPDWAFSSTGTLLSAP